MACRGPAHRGPRQKVQEPTPDKKLWGGPSRRSQSVGGLSGLVPVHGEHGKPPSTSELHSRADLEGNPTGVGVQEMAKKQHSEKKKKEKKDEGTVPEKDARTNASNHWAVTQQSSQLRTLLLLLVPPSLIQRTRASASSRH